MNLILKRAGVGTLRDSLHLGAMKRILDIAGATLASLLPSRKGQLLLGGRTGL